MARRKLGTGRDRFDSEEDKKALLDRVYELTVQTPKLSKAQIADMINRSEKMVYLYWQDLIKLGRLTASESGRPERPEAAIRQAEFEEMSKTDFVQKNPSVQTWITKMLRGGKKGTGLKGWQDNVTALYEVCATLRIRPDAFLISSSETAELMEKFKEIFLKGETQYVSKEKGYAAHSIMKSGTDTSIRRYASAVANFCMRNDKQLPKGMDGALSRKKENYGAYSTVKLSDKEVAGMIEFFRNHPDGGEDWAALVAIHHEMITRSETMMNWKVNLVFKEDYFDGVLCKWAEAPQVYEAKTHANFDKLIIHPTAVQIARNLKQGETIIKEKINNQQKIKDYNRLCREYYASIGRIAPEAITNHKFYKKVVDGDRYYLALNPNYTMRHSGCHMWARRCKYNATIIMSLGWEDPKMITDVYGKMPSEFRLRDSACHYCNPQSEIKTDNDDVFCSWNHALIYYNNGQISKAEMLAKRQGTGVAA
ncbi:MAG: hypothetical protein KGJ07_00575 [Patescibacteria group bacterium]|nr:hypothetical protein [Patescibacteria group bacterium]